MSLIKVVTILLILSFSRKVDGAKRIISDSSDNETGPEDLEFSCCQIDNTVFYTIFDALSNISSNTIVNITRDSVLNLESVVLLQDLTNITIVGHKNPTINCNGTGALKFAFCSYVAIEGVSWKGCGYNSNSGIGFYHSNDISIKNCSFQYSAGQAIAMLEVSGNVCINNSKFTNNTNYSGHGAVLYYTSYVTENHTKQLLVINNCKFTSNIATNSSVVYIQGDFTNVTTNRSVKIK